MGTGSFTWNIVCVENTYVFHSLHYAKSIYLGNTNLLQLYVYALWRQQQNYDVKEMTPFSHFFYNI